MPNFRKTQNAIFITLLAATITVGVIFILFGSDSKINQNNLQLIRSYGWIVDEKPAEIVRLTIPDEFDAIYDAYNSIGKTAGFDLYSHRGEIATRYSYRVNNHRDSETGMLRANVIVTKNGIISADISSLEFGGNIQAISDTSGQLP